MNGKQRSLAVLVSLLSVVVLLAALVTPVEAGGKKPAPPQSHAFGKTLAEWNTAYWTWFLQGGSPETGQVGHVLFLPIPQDGVPSGENPVVYVGELDVTMRRGTAFVLPVLAYLGERYGESGVPDDAFLPREIFTEGVIKVELDGATLIDGAVDDLDAYYYEASFAQPIPYGVPQPRGEFTAVAGIWTQGIGFVYPPMSVGQHTLTLYSEYKGFGVAYSNTWHITVKR